MEVQPYVHWKTRAKNEPFDHERFTQAVTVRLPESAVQKMAKFNKWERGLFMRTAVLNALQQVNLK